MKEIKFVPKACLDGGEFEGHALMRVPMFDERYEMLDQMGLKMDAATGEMGTGDLNTFGALRKMVAASKNFYKEVLIKHKDGREFKSFEDLASDPDCDGIVVEIASALSRGFRAGKN